MKWFVSFQSSRNHSWFTIQWGNWYVVIGMCDCWTVFGLAIVSWFIWIWSGKLSWLIRFWSKKLAEFLCNFYACIKIAGLFQCNFFRSDSFRKLKGYHQPTCWIWPAKLGDFFAVMSIQCFRIGGWRYGNFHLFFGIPFWK